MARKKLTARFVESVVVEGRTDFWDDIVRGLVLRASPTGAKSWSVVYTRESDRRKRRVTLGAFPGVSLGKARKKALDTLSSIADGEDPAGLTANLKASMTVADLSTVYLEKYAIRTKRSWREDRRILNVEVLPFLGDMKVGKVQRRDIIKLLDQKAANGRLRQADMILAIVRKMFNWAVEKDHIESSPVSGLKPTGSQTKRDRFLTNDEISEVWFALPSAGLSPPMKDIVKLLLLTGQRSGEVSGILRQEIDLEAAMWRLPKERSKNKLAHDIPLTGAALDIIVDAMQREPKAPNAPLFTTIGKPIQSNAVSQTVRKNLQLFDQRWTPHDCRRTVATGMAKIGILPHVIEAAFNHISGFKSGVAGIYNRHLYEDEKRNAFARWDTHLASILEKRRPVIIPLNARDIVS